MGLLPDSLKTVAKFARLDLCQTQAAVGIMAVEGACICRGVGNFHEKDA